MVINVFSSDTPCCRFCSLVNRRLTARCIAAREIQQEVIHTQDNTCLVSMFYPLPSTLTLTEAVLLSVTDRMQKWKQYETFLTGVLVCLPHGSSFTRIALHRRQCMECLLPPHDLTKFSSITDGRWQPGPSAQTPERPPTPPIGAGNRTISPVVVVLCVCPVVL